MSINQRELLSLSYSCAAAFSVWIPKPLQPQLAAEKLSLAELKKEHLSKDYWSSDSPFCKDIGSSKANRV
ncbi:MAG: hypothetical protein ACFFCW_18655 [Candidatus Hodarchaeota archaeon]